MSVPHAYAFREIEADCRAVQRVIADVLGHGKGGFSAVQARACRGHQPPKRPRAAEDDANLGVVTPSSPGEGGNGCMHMENGRCGMRTPTAAFARSGPDAMSPA